MAGLSQQSPNINVSNAHLNRRGMEEIPLTTEAVPLKETFKGSGVSSLNRILLKGLMCSKCSSEMVCSYYNAKMQD